MESRGSSPSPTVLVVDDEDGVREIASRILERAGYNVLRAGSGSDALRLLRTVVPDVLVTDIRMPEMDGVDLALEVGRARKFIPILFMTGFANSEAADMARTIGPVLKKPFVPDELRGAVQRVICTPGRKAREPAARIVEPEQLSRPH